MEKEQPIVSVIIPAYNCEKSISKAINSVLAQDILLELIIINDCSEDETDSIIQSYLPNPNIMYLKNETNLGAAKTRNRGVLLTHGDYIAFLDSDDWWDKTKLSKQLALIKKENRVLCATGRELMKEDGRTTGKIIPVRETISYRMMLKQNWINCSSVLLKREIALKYPMEHEDSHEDYITWLLILHDYQYACAVNEPLLKYRLSSKGKSGNKLKSAKMTFKVYRYLGFSWWKSILCFICYAWNGFRKYL